MPNEKRLVSTGPASGNLKSSHSSQCSYCGVPLPRHSLAGSDSEERYCCYGCKLLGDHGEKGAVPNHRSPWFKIGLGAALSGQGMVIGLAVNLSHPTGIAKWGLHGWLIVTVFLVFSILGPSLLKECLNSLREKQVRFELLFLSGCFGAVIASFYSTVTGRGDVYYEIAAVLLTVYTIGKTLAADARRRAVAETDRLNSLFSRCFVENSSGEITEKPVEDVHSGERIRVFPGGAIPIDGVVLQGTSFVLETPLTGEPFPVVRQPGDRVISGSFAEDGSLLIKAETSGRHRRFDRLIQQLESAREQLSECECHGDRIVRWFLPSVLLISVLTFTFWTGFDSLGSGLFNSMAVLLVACPCAMGLATPIALWSAFSALAARGVVVFKGESIERLAAVDCLYFDKTGTLTEEQYSLIDLTTSGTPQERSRLISDLALVQSHSAHPIARAFHSLGSGSVNGRVVGKLKTHPGLGIEATISSNGEVIRQLRIGRLELMESTDGISELTERSRRCEGDQCLYVQSNGRLEALAVIRERVRQSAQTAVTALHGLGIEVGVLTGDRIERCIETEFPGVQAGLRPEDKVRIIQQQRDNGHSVAFVGDGVNDAPAVAAADVGVVLAHGADITSSHADIILYGNDLTRIPWAIALSRKVLQSIHSNFRFAVFYNGIGIVLAACGLLHPIVAALLMVGSSAVVSWRASNSCAGLDPCCGVTPENSDKAGNEKKEQQETHQWGTGLGIAFAGQGPLVSYLGDLSGFESTMVVLSFLFIGMLLIRFGHQWYLAGRNTGMILRMLAYGNWGMLVGWWMDAGLGQVMADGVCLCCQSRHYFNMESFEVPWMVVGMLGFGLPGMLLDPRIAPKLWDKIVQGVFSSVGMIWGMFTGADLVLNLAGPLHPHQFLFAFAGMGAGMLIGMVFFCELGRRFLSLSKPLMKVASS